MPHLSFLDLVNQTDNVPYPDSPLYEHVAAAYTFMSHDSVPLGLITSPVATELSLFPDTFHVDRVVQTVSLAADLDTFSKRNAAVARAGAALRSRGAFKAVLDGWRDELYVVYDRAREPYLLVERAVSCLLGVVTYGVHINGYLSPGTAQPARVVDGRALYFEKQGGAGFRFWVSKRSETKPTFPGMLDNTVAGGLGYPYGVLESAIKECGEEAGLSPEYVRARLRPAGCITYWFMKEYGADCTLFQPECQYIYDMEMDEDTVPLPVDGEVAAFWLLSEDELREELAAGKFKPNCALVAIDFLIRNGRVDSTTEKDYVELIQRMHRRFPFPLM